MAVRASMLGSLAVETMIYGRLKGLLSQSPRDDDLVTALIDSPVNGRVHRWPLPEDWPLPSIVFQRYGGSIDTGGVGRGAPVIASTVLYQVKAIAEGYDLTPIESAAQIMNDLLDGASSLVNVTTDYGSVDFWVECTRESELLTELPPEDDGAVFTHLGGQYQFFVTRLSEP